MQKRGDIACTVGILTFNSGAFLERCLRGLSEFAEVLIADGGSTDETLAIAREYGCTIIGQSNPGHPITDFALERNRLIEAASYDWFLSLDSDELITPELVREIRMITTNTTPEVFLYRVPYKIVSEDLRTVYASFKTYYQFRFFNRLSGARYARKVHERIEFDAATPYGTLTGCWHVPLDIQLNFSIYKGKVDHRIRIMVQERPPKTFFQYLRRMTLDPVKNIAKQFIKFVWLRLRYPASELPPARYELYKLYSQYVFMKEATRQYLKVRTVIKTCSYAVAYAVRTISLPFSRKEEIAVLMYHAIDGSGERLSVYPEVFRQHLEYLKRRHTVVPLEDIVNYVQRTTLLPKKAVAITFDDAYRDILTVVSPLLQEYDMSATVFVPTNMEVYTNNAHTSRLSWNDIRALASTGRISFQSHGRNHQAIPHLSDKSRDEELLGSMRDLEHELGKPPHFFAYPFGARDAKSEQAVRQAGYIAAFSITEGMVQPGDDMFHIKRIQVDETMSLRLFAWRLTRAVDIHRWFIDLIRRI